MGVTRQGERAVLRQDRQRIRRMSEAQGRNIRRQMAEDARRMRLAAVIIADPHQIEITMMPAHHLRHIFQVGNTGGPEQVCDARSILPMIVIAQDRIDTHGRAQLPEMRHDLFHRHVTAERQAPDHIIAGEQDDVGMSGVRHRHNLVDLGVVDIGRARMQVADHRDGHVFEIGRIDRHVIAREADRRRFQPESIQPQPGNQDQPQGGQKKSRSHHPSPNIRTDRKGPRCRPCPGRPPLALRWHWGPH